jgi:hypothetical protein
MRLVNQKADVITQTTDTAPNSVVSIVARSFLYLLSLMISASPSSMIGSGSDQSFQFYSHPHRYRDIVIVIPQTSCRHAAYITNSERGDFHRPTPTSNVCGPPHRTGQALTLKMLLVREVT